MTEPLSFPDASPRHALPFLFVGQAQKEFHVNEVITRLDFLVHAQIIGVASVAPVAPQAGDCWLVGPDASGPWSGEIDSLAGWSGADWVFCKPRQGMRVWDMSAGQYRGYADGWRAAGAPANPDGGTTVDAEARIAIESLINAMADHGIFPKP